MAKATELFLEHFAREAQLLATAAERKSIRYEAARKIKQNYFKEAQIIFTRVRWRWTRTVRGAFFSSIVQTGHHSDRESVRTCKLARPTISICKSRAAT